MDKCIIDCLHMHVADMEISLPNILTLFAHEEAELPVSSMNNRFLQLGTPCCSSWTTMLTAQVQSYAVN